MRRALSWRRAVALAAVCYAALLLVSNAVREDPPRAGALTLPGATDVWRFSEAPPEQGSGPLGSLVITMPVGSDVSAQSAARSYGEALGRRTGIVLVAEGRTAPFALALAAERADAINGVILVEPRGFAASELLGSDLLNRLLFELAAAAKWFAREAFPHFGALDSRIPRLPIERILARTDSNRVLERAAAAEVPVVILAAPGALPADHLGSVLPVTARDDDLDPAPWVARLGTGESLAAPTATEPWALPRVEQTGLLRFGGLVFAASMVSEDLASVGVGLLLGEGRVGVGAALGVTAFALLLGDLVLVIAGRWLGAGLGMRAFPVPGEMLFWSRFVPGARLPTYVAAGMNRMPLPRVIGWLGFAVLLWAPVIVLLTAGGGRLARRFLGAERVDPIHLVLAAAAVLLVLRIGAPLLRAKGRRRLRGRVIRLTRFEYWPLFVFYAPLVPYLLYLMARHRSMRAPLLANPGIEGGGLVGESKWRIHQSFREGAAYLPATMFVPAVEPTEAVARGVERWFSENELHFPLIAKPDVAERGRGVRRLSDEAELSDYLSSREEDILLQAFVPGTEFGVFYIRHPAREEGEVFAIVHKDLPSVVGDGVHTLEELVLEDPRAVAMEAAYRENAGEAWTQVPAAGERIPLVRIGTHSRGARFLDGARFRTPALTASVERIAQNFPGFHFGRLDLRAPDEDAIREGRAFGLLEVNGLTAEAAHFYDPAYGVLDAYRWLFRQWRIAFEIGVANAAAGIEVPSLSEIWALWQRGRQP